ncbi:hypothetical protein [Hyalangium gracile]|uniref:hypothetical protein n=1 Tax=Hyalangium gracile TaxID=394092 RepID=UPI001CCB0045|nr:hypothetical protein [Hyalangium gracile]
MKSLRFISALLLSTLVTACGGSGHDFVGTYTASGTATMSIDDYEDNTTQLGGTVTISEGIGSDLILTDPSAPNCVIPLNVQDGVALVAQGSSCTESVDGVRVTMTFKAGSATSNGKVVQLTYSGTLNAVLYGDTYPGSFTTTATLMRVGK